MCIPMDQPAFTVAAEEFRAEIRRYLADNHPGRRPKGGGEVLAWQRAWSAKLADDGWAMPSWPKQWGGMDLPLELQYVYHEEMAQARLRSGSDAGQGRSA